MKTSKLALKIAITASILTASAAQAELITYDLEWSGIQFENNATATGQVTIDTDLVPNPGFYSGVWAGSAFSNFSITIIDALSGNGTFSTANGDFSEVIWSVGEDGPGLGNGGGGDPVDPIDLHAELMGQIGFSDFNVFNSTSGGDLAGPGDPDAPNGWAPFVLLTGGDHNIANGGPGSGDLIELVSMRPVPAPSSIALLGLGALATTRRRR